MKYTVDIPSEMDVVEAMAFAIYAEFIRNASGSLRKCQDVFGNWEAETPEEATLRRWDNALPAVRESFRREAMAALATGERWRLKDG